MPARSAEIAFILAAWSPTSLATFLAKSATRLAAMAARSAARFDSSLGLAAGFLAGGWCSRLGHLRAEEPNAGGETNAQRDACAEQVHQQKRANGGGQ